MPRARSTVVVALLAAAVVLAGCGGAMQPDELARSIGTLESAAAEGALLARDVADDRTKATFARAHARDLGETVDHEAEKLSDASANGLVAERKTAAVNLADRISQALGQIQVSPGSEREGRTAQASLTHFGDRAGKLAEGL
jgi:outer membrane murein-binding lipoprotein Lpp